MAILRVAAAMALQYFLHGYGDHRDLHSFPTRRSSDLPQEEFFGFVEPAAIGLPAVDERRIGQRGDRDRKSTRLNSSHTVISYAVFCLKKKKYGVKIEYIYPRPPYRADTAGQARCARQS